MPITHNDRLTAAHEGPLVVFIIGLRINHFRKFRQWVPVARAMGPMLGELYAHPEIGFLGHQTMLAGLRTLTMVQYWRDFDSLESYALSREKAHWPAWAAFNKAVGTDGSVGIYHETYSVAAQESVYVNMPPFGLGRITGLVPATQSRQSARERMRRT
jgi:hypothetical protein